MSSSIPVMQLRKKRKAPNPCDPVIPYSDSNDELHDNYAIDKALYYINAENEKEILEAVAQAAPPPYPPPSDSPPLHKKSRRKRSRRNRYKRVFTKDQRVILVFVCVV